MSREPAPRVDPATDGSTATELRLMSWIVVAIAAVIHIALILLMYRESAGGSESAQRVTAASTLALVLTVFAAVLTALTGRVWAWRQLARLMHLWGSFGCFALAGLALSEFLPFSFTQYRFGVFSRTELHFGVMVVGGLPAPLQLFLARSLREGIRSKVWTFERHAVRDTFD